MSLKISNQKVKAARYRFNESTPAQIRARILKAAAKVKR